MIDYDNLNLLERFKFGLPVSIKECATIYQKMFDSKAIVRKMK